MKEGGKKVCLCVSVSVRLCVSVCARARRLAGNHMIKISPLFKTNQEHNMKTFLQATTNMKSEKDV